MMQKVTLQKKKKTKVSMGHSKLSASVFVCNLGLFCFLLLSSYCHATPDSDIIFSVNVMKEVSLQKNKMAQYMTI